MMPNIFKVTPIGTHWPVIFPFKGRHRNQEPGARIIVTKGSLLLSAFLLFSISVFSQQNVTTDIQNINLAIFDSKNLQMNISYQVFMDDALQSQMQGIVKKNGNMVYQQTGNITIIKKEPYCLFIDSDRKLMVLDPYYPEENKINRDDILNLNVDSLKPHILSTESRDKGQDREYIFTLKKGQFSRIILEFNTKTFFLKKMELYKREHYQDQLGAVHVVKMFILFNEVDNKISIPESAFDLSAYVSIDAKKKKAKTTTGFKNYQFNSNIDKSVKFK